MRTLSAALGVLLALHSSIGAHGFLVPAIPASRRRSSSRCTMMAARTNDPAAGAGAGVQGQQGQQQEGWDRRQALQTTGAWAMGASALLSAAGLVGSRPRPALAVEEADPAAFIFPNVSEPAFGAVCFLEFAEAAKDGKKFGRVEVSLYDGVGTGKVAENFKALCAGSGGVGYKGSNVYRILKDYSIQAGDIGSKKRGAGGTSSFGEPFVVGKEGFRVRHSLEGMVSMAGVGKVDSRFFFNLGKDSSWADDRYVAFGRVTKGMEVLRELEKVDVKTPSNNPTKQIIISDAGVL